MTATELLLTAREEDGEAVLEFRVGAAGADELNLQDHLAWLGTETRTAGVEQEIHFVCSRTSRPRFDTSSFTIWTS